MATVFLATAVVQWPAGLILLAATLLIPLNMRLAGLFAQVIAALHEATRGRTVVVATHSAALMRAADAVLALAVGTLHSREPIAA
jgi:ABC-type transport system involved in cytochrome bd biosynthesis fused ATPase/permease subunit